MEDTLAAIADDTASLVQTWHQGDLLASVQLCRRVVDLAGLEYPAIAAAADHWERLTTTSSSEDAVRCEAALALLVSAVRRARTVANA
ncbi:hypothetical protein [Luteibacter sp. 22Crub2.1]|uniref:hypothetical protein n=1 Tax=Luteibacter sp. 22Crub2.1 TaxID=1283288 RepID=UPI0009A67CBF|nr:hypothetical protein [Luteibacter sp. 22Crub2.1]SKB27917.1 hypothetical protein SAMN05660880_00306 [Luteibacter sp. 22Crub2.1]